MEVDSRISVEPEQESRVMYCFNYDSGDLACGSKPSSFEFEVAVECCDGVSSKKFVTTTRAEVQKTKDRSSSRNSG